MFLGPQRLPVAAVRDVEAHELAAITPLLGLALLIGVLPRPLLDVIEPAARSVVDLVAR